MLPESPKPMIAGVRWILVIAGVLVLIAGFQLFILTEQTAQFFAWTIGVPLTAAFIGGVYWASLPLVLLAARERLWANGRISLLSVFPFVVLTLLATLLHWDKFHLGDQFPIMTQFVTWAWIAVYVSLPFLIGLLITLQIRTKGTDPARKYPLPFWFRGASFIYALLMILIGIGLFVAPDSVKSLWPWELTPLTGRIVGAWLVALGSVSLEVGIENDWRRIFPAMIGALAFGLLELLAVLRYAAALVPPNDTVYITCLVVLVALGIYGSAKSLRARRMG